MTTHFPMITIGGGSVSSESDLVATLRMIPGTRTSRKGSKWLASCRWNGRRFEAEARNGAVYALCPALVRAGCPNQPLDVRSADGQLELRIGSIQAGASVTIRESNKTPIKLAPYKPYEPRERMSASKRPGAISSRRLCQQPSE